MIWLNPAQAAARIGVSRFTLHNWWKKRYGPVRYKHGGLVRYKIEEIDQWLDQQRGK